MERKIGLSSRRAFSKADSPQGSHSTGLWACCRKYGLFSLMSALVKPEEEDSTYFLAELATILLFG